MVLLCHRHKKMRFGILVCLAFISIFYIHHQKKNATTTTTKEETYYFGKAVNKTITSAINDTVVYVHFHKAGGTSFVSTFQSALNAWEPNKNGNPYVYLDENHTQMTDVKFWKYDRNQFREFQEEARRQKVNFMATEWGFFERLGKEDLKNFNVQLVTCIREPYERFVSNLLFANRNNPDDLQRYRDNPLAWISSNHYHLDNNTTDNTNKPNYYIGFMSGVADDRSYDYKLNRSHLEIAKERMSWFDTIFLLDRPETFRMLQKWFPIDNNDNDNNDGQEQLQLVHLNDYAKRIKPFINLSQEEFYKFNALDLELYEYAVNLSLAQLAQLDSS